MEKIAVISDIHANKQALLSVLEDCKKRKVNKIICLGDIIAKGIYPEECIKLIKDNCKIVIQGNCDEFNSKVNLNFLEGISEMDQKRAKWNKEMLTDESVKYLKSLPFSYEFYLSGRLVRLFHATPTNIRGTIISANSIEEKYKMFLPSKKTMSQETADIVLYGHIHQQYMDTLYNKTIINVGSVGNSFMPIRNKEKDSNILETTNAQYVILQGDYEEKEYTGFSFSFIRVPYNIEQELEHQENNIEKESYKTELTQGIYRNMEKIENSYQELGIDMKKF